MFGEVNGNVSLRGELHPDINSGLLLDISHDGVELEELASFRWLVDLEAHWVLALIEKCQPFPINVVQQTDLEIVAGLLHPNRHLHTVSYECHVHRRRVHKVLDVEYQLQLERTYFFRLEFELQCFSSVPSNVVDFVNLELLNENILLLI